MEELEERHQVEIKVYKQKVRARRPRRVAAPAQSLSNGARLTARAL